MKFYDLLCDDTVAYFQHWINNYRAKVSGQIEKSQKGKSKLVRRRSGFNAFASESILTLSCPPCRFRVEFHPERPYRGNSGLHASIRTEIPPFDAEF